MPEEIDPSNARPDAHVVPLRIGATGHLHVVGLLGGQPVEWVLDTGAGATIIDTSRAEHFGLIAGDEGDTATGVGAEGVTTLRSEGNTLVFAGKSFPDRTLLLMDIDHLNEAIIGLGEGRVDGLIGADLLLDLGAVIDYSSMELRLRESK